MINNLKSISLVYNFVSEILPKVNKEISYWENFVRLSISGELKIQALSSLREKNSIAKVVVFMPSCLMLIKIIL